MRIVLITIAAACMFSSCNTKSDYEKIIHDPILFSNTVHQLNQVVMGNNFSPIVASRNYAYASIAAYEVMAAGNTDKYLSLGGQLHGLSDVPKPEAGKKIDFELASILAFTKLGEAVTFPEGSMHEYTDSIKNLAKEHGMPADVLQNSIAFADKVSAVILRWSKKDNYLQSRTFPRYTVIDTPGRWVPTPPAYTPAMEPHWNSIRAFVLDSASQFIPPRPPAFNVTDNSSVYYKEVMKVKNAVDSLTDEQKHIAEFWDDNPFKLNVSGHMMFGTKKFSPPGHWMSIVGIAAKKANYDFVGTVFAYAITAITQFDAFLQCWDEKFRSNCARPETVINKYFDQNWTPFLQTPPFPEYTCGHSTVSSANAEALTYVFGDNFAYTDTSEMEFGIKSRSFTSFRNAAIENNWARFYGGIHFHNSCLVSTEYGKKVGNFVLGRINFKK
jgi:hypothetical protein